MKRNLVSRRQFIQSAAAVSVAFVTPKIAWGQTSADVIVIGAGMSGLKAALLLEAQRPQAPGDHAKDRLCYSIRSRRRGCPLF